MTDNGGSAFPNTSTDTGHANNVPQGMSMRDYFAGKALTGLLAKSGQYQSWLHLAQDSYDIANAMLAERNRINL